MEGSVGIGIMALTHRRTLSSGLHCIRLRPPRNQLGEHASLQPQITTTNQLTRTSRHPAESLSLPRGWGKTTGRLRAERRQQVGHRRLRKGPVVAAVVPATQAVLAPKKERAGCQPKQQFRRRWVGSCNGRRPHRNRSRAPKQKQREQQAGAQPATRNHRLLLQQAPND
jgi:hypothetical protein